MSRPNYLIKGHRLVSFRAHHLNDGVESTCMSGPTGKNYSHPFSSKDSNRIGNLFAVKKENVDMQVDAESYGGDND